MSTATEHPSTQASAFTLEGILVDVGAALDELEDMEATGIAPQPLLGRTRKVWDLAEHAVHRQLSADSAAALAELQLAYRELRALRRQLEV